MFCIELEIQIQEEDAESGTALRPLKNFPKT